MTTTATTKQQCGMLAMYYGPMYSGKTAELLREHQRYVVSGRLVLLLKPMTDTRLGQSNSEVRSRNAQTASAVLTHTLCEQLEVARRNYDVIMVDELQFFGKRDVLTFVQSLLAAHKHVVVAGLDGDYRRKAYKQVLQLVPLARRTTKLMAVCMFCRDADAPYTYYEGAAFSGFHVGDAGYSAACERCYHDRHYNNNLQQAPSDAERAYAAHVNASIDTVLEISHRALALIDKQQETERMARGTLVYQLPDVQTVAQALRDGAKYDSDQQQKQSDPMPIHPTVAAASTV